MQTAEFLEQFDENIQNQIQENDPKELIEQAKPTNVPQVYIQNPIEINHNKPLIIIICGPSGAGKETAVEEYELSGKMNRIVSATTRDRRENERESDYVWMRKQREGEDLKTYHES